ncbi:FimV/HubP family polar landmark protein [Hahella ganghwensis]|uniref:FimV/HubP family polar landmark protein n=1 Tax=Hahella ganghwensis TaxID=286420 RepID=UPI0003755653|nr:FimV/HubP family polar landmark protein [Hahella ganghwensis]
MVRKLAIAAFTLSALTAGVARALGLGEVTVNSYLNQPLSAEIQLVNVRDLEQNEILTNLASREEFLKAGVDRVYFLSDLRFKVDQRSDGSTIIRVTSSKAVREPFLNFLVEVNWPTGRLLREYALLIDPPTYSSEPVAPVQAPQTQVTQQVTTPEPTPTRQQPTRETATTSSQASAPSTTGGTYGPTGGDDTMWSIALKTRPDSSVSPQKMMLAIQDLNPGAFFDGNINRLKSGQVLRLPNREEIDSRTSREAISAVSIQNREFAEGSKQRTVDAASEKEVVTSTGQAARDELRVIVGDGAEEASGDATVAGTADSGGGSLEDLTLAKEQLDKTTRENEELKSRLEDLQGQMETLQRLIELKDDQLAALQGEAAVSEAETIEPGISEGITPEGTGSDVQIPEESGETVTPEAMSPESMTTEGQMTPLESPESMTPQVEEEPVPVEEAVTPTVEEEKPAVQPKPIEPVVEEESFVDMIMNNLVYQIAIAAGGVVVLLILWLLFRGRGSKDEGLDEGLEDNDTVITFEEDDQLPVTAVESESGEGAGSDPVAEADVYVAYQKYGQAEQVLEAALEEQPNNYEYRLKLLEVLGEAKEAAKFSAAFAALEASGDADVLERAGDIKARYSDLSDEPEVSLDDLESQLMGGGDDFASEEELQGTDLSDDFELDVDNLDDVEETVIQSEAQADFVQEESLDLEGESSSVESEDDLDIEFDLSDIDLDDTSTGMTTEDLAEPEAQDEDFAGMDLNLDEDLSTDDLEDTVNQPPMVEPMDEGFNLDLEEEIQKDSSGDDLDLDFSEEMLDFDSESETPAEESTLDVEEELSLDLDDNDLDFSLDEQGAGLSDEEEKALQGDDVEDFSLDTLDEEADLDLDLGEVSEDLQDDSKAEGLSEDIAEEFVQEMDFLEEESDAQELNVDDLGSPDETMIQPPAGAQQEVGGEEKTAKPQDEFVTEMEEDFDFLSDTDESATKLDLARAYIDMGDKEGARDILEEVVDEGNDTQKQEAADLLKGLE